MIVYYTLKYYAKLVTTFYFKKIEFDGSDKIPSKTPTIFVTNHQNAFLDAIVVGAWQKNGSMHFLTRASVFKKRLVRWLLGLLQMMPIYRIRDGVAAVKKNDEIFETCVQILEQKGCLLIFAEGNHGIRKNLRPLQKGISRIAFEAEQRNDFKLGVQIVPIGLNYENISAFRTNLFVHVGDPLFVNLFETEYTADNNEGMLRLKDQLAKRLAPLIINISNDGYDSKLTTWLSVRKKQKTLKAQFKHDQSIIENIESGKISLQKSSLKSRKGMWLNPLTWYVVINHLVPLFVLRKILKPIKDRAFWGSVKFAVGMVLVPLMYVLQFSVVYYLTENIIWSIAYLISLPLLGLWVYDYYKSEAL